MPLTGGAGGRATGRSWVEPKWCPPWAGHFPSLRSSCAQDTYFLMIKTQKTQWSVVQQTSHKLKKCFKMGVLASRTCLWSWPGEGRDECNAIFKTILTEIALKAQAALGSLDNLPILISLIHEHKSSFHFIYAFCSFYYQCLIILM